MTDPLADLSFDELVALSEGYAEPYEENEREIACLIAEVTRRRAAEIQLRAKIAEICLAIDRQAGIQVSDVQKALRALKWGWGPQ